MPAPAVPVPTPVGDLVEMTDLAMVALDRIVPSPHNPRKTFAAEPLDQLAKSIREKGVLEPILVRPRYRFTVERGDDEEPDSRDAVEEEEVNGPVQLWYVVDTTKTKNCDQYCDEYPTEPEASAEAKSLNEKYKADGYELVAGERRWRAAKLAGLRVIPCLIRQLDDKAAAEVAVIENDQREDVPPLEQAEGYARLIRLGDDAETIAAKIGRPVKYVVGRLHLTHLIDELKEELRRGDLPFGHAYLLSRLTAEDQRTLATPKKYGNGKSDLYDYHDNPISLSELRSKIKDGFLPCLSAAPWKKDDATLTPAGACTSCPRRAGQNPTLFDELVNGDKPGRDFCTDRKCYAEKHEAFIVLQLRKASADAGGVDPVKVSTEYYSGGGDGVLDKTAYEIVSKKGAKDAKPGELKPAVVVFTGRGTSDGVGKIVQVRLKKQSGNGSTSNADAKWKAQRAADQKRADKIKLAAVKAVGQVAAAATKELIGGATGLPFDMLKQLVLVLVDTVWEDGVRLVSKRRELGKGSPRELVEKHIEALNTSADIFALVAELLAGKRASNWDTYHKVDKDELAFWKVFCVDPGKLIKEALKADKPKPITKAMAKAGKAKVKA